MNAAVALLMKLGWEKELDLVVQGYPERPVFYKGHRKVVVGPIWLTYYTIRKCVIAEMDSVKTDNLKAVEEAVS